MASKPLQTTTELYGSNLGPEKLPGDRYLRDIADETLLGLSQETFDKSKARDPSLGGEVGNLGPEKLPGDEYLREKLDPMTDVLFRTKAALENPQGDFGPPHQVKTGSIAILAQRRSVENFLGLGGSLLDKASSPIGFFYHENAEQRRRRLRGITSDPFENTQTTFGTIEDAGLTADQMERYEALVDEGRLDPDTMFDQSGITTMLGLMGINAASSGKYQGTGVTYRDAVEIVVGNSREGISQFDPTTGVTWDLKDLRAARDLQNDYLRFQGLPPIYVGNTIVGVKPNEFLFQRFPFDESKPKRQGTGGERQQIRGDNLNYQLTMEEALQVAELVSGKSRLYQNPRQAQNNPSFDETLLYGDYVL